jgi:hypothetical protein
MKPNFNINIKVRKGKGLLFRFLNSKEHNEQVTEINAESEARRRSTINK